MMLLQLLKDKLLNNIKSRQFAKFEPDIAKIIDLIHNDRLTYIEKNALIDLAKVVIENDKKSVNGAILEAGCALGGSAILLAKAKKKTRHLVLYDVFGMIPPPSVKDGQDVHERYHEIMAGNSQGIKGDIYYGYKNDLLNKVQNTFRTYGLEPQENNIFFFQGLYQDTVNIDFPISLVHIDCDWYESVTLCLERITPHVVPGGTLVIDDYYHWSGCTTAVDEYFKNSDKERFVFKKLTRLHIKKKG